MKMARNLQRNFYKNLSVFYIIPLNKVVNETFKDCIVLGINLAQWVIQNLQTIQKMLSKVSNSVLLWKNVLSHIVRRETVHPNWTYIYFIPLLHIRGERFKLKIDELLLHLVIKYYLLNNLMHNDMATSKWFTFIIIYRC